MKRIKTIAFVFVPIYIGITRTRVPKSAVVVSSQDRHLQDRREATSDWPFWTWFIGNPSPEILGFVMRTIFQSISHGLRGRLTQKQGEK
jgi:hypothetical protein